MWAAFLLLGLVAERRDQGSDLGLAGCAADSIRPAGRAQRFVGQIDPVDRHLIAGEDVASVDLARVEDRLAATTADGLQLLGGTTPAAGWHPGRRGSSRCGCRRPTPGCHRAPPALISASTWAGKELGLVHEDAQRPARAGWQRLQSNLVRKSSPGPQQHVHRARDTEARNDLVVALDIDLWLDEQDALVAFLVVVGNLQQRGGLAGVHGAVAEVESLATWSSQRRGTAGSQPYGQHRNGASAGVAQQHTGVVPVLGEAQDADATRRCPRCLPEDRRPAGDWQV